MIAEDVEAFRAALPEGGRLLGLDVGTKTIGIATCDADWTIATPFRLEKRGKLAEDLAMLRRVAREEKAAGLVIGHPLGLDGRASAQTQKVRAFAGNLAPLDLPILLWDERWSTAAVTRTLLAADASRARRAGLVDKMAAAYILQGAIDRLGYGAL